jgi:hypothetical protein
MSAAWPLVLGLSALGLSAALFLPGCAETARGPLPGASDAWESAPDVHAAPSAQPAPLPVWDTYAEVQHWPAASTAPFTSRGHQPEQLVEVRVSEPARASYAALVTDTVFPEGAVLVELTRGTGHSYAMRKTGGTWSYIELDARGAVLANGSLPLCIACHAQAPADRVFGPPRGP